MSTLNYTEGNWDIASLNVDSVVGAKSFASITDLSYNTDYSVKAGSTANDARLINTTGSSILPCEELSYGKLDVADIYAASRFKVPVLDRIPNAKGVQVRIRVDDLLYATNSVSGQECQVPIAGWVNVLLPSNAMINSTAIRWLMNRLFGACSKKGATTVDTMILDLARGDVDPTK